MVIRKRVVTDPTQDAFARSTPIQAEKLETMLKMSWKVMSVYTRNGKSAIGLSSKNTGAWLLPDGKLVRPKIGESAAQLDMKWLD